MNRSMQISTLVARAWALAVAALCGCASITSAAAPQRGGRATREESRVTEVIGGLEQDVRVLRTEAAKPNTGHELCGVGRMEGEERQREMSEYFASARWKPQRVPPGCTGRPAPQPTIEARQIDALASAEPALFNCMRLHGISYELPLALETDQRCMERESVRAHTEIAVNVHGPTGRVVGVAAVANPRMPAFDACLAEVFAATCFVPFETPQATRPYWSSRYPYFVATPQHRQHLAEVKSSCLSLERSHDTTGPSLEELAEAVRPALPAVRACYGKNGFELAGRQWVEVAIDGENGGIGKAAAAYTPRRPVLDACIAEALVDVCVTPFRGIIRDSYNSLLRRSVFSFEAVAPK